METNNIPEFFIEMLNKQYGEEKTTKIIEGFKVKRYVTFRVNTLKTNVEEIEKILNESSIVYERIKWYNDAFILKNISEKQLQEMEIYKEGKIYLQSLSSMIPPIILEPKENIDILDMCAAPRR